MGSYYDGHQSGPFAGGDRNPGSAGRVQGSAGLTGRPPGFMGLQSSSFADFLDSHSPGLLPGRITPGPGADGGPGQAIRDLPHATTIVAAVCEHGVVLAGDRRP